MASIPVPIAADPATEAFNGVPESEDTDPPGYASQRWARLIHAVASAQGDVRTLEQWSLTAGVSTSAIRTWCRAAGVSARRSLELARLLRILAQRRGQRWRPYEALDIVDSRTMTRLLTRAGLPHAEARAAVTPTVDTFLSTQTFVRERHLLDSLRWSLAGLDA